MTEKSSEPDPPEPPQGASPGPEDPTLLERVKTELRPDGMAFGQRLTVLRRRRQWTGNALAALTGVAASTISALERGHTPRPDADTAQTLARAFGYKSAQEMMADDLTASGRRQRGNPRPAPPDAGDVGVGALMQQVLEAAWRVREAHGRRAPRITMLATVVMIDGDDPEDDPAPEPPAPEPPAPPVRVAK